MSLINSSVVYAVYDRTNQGKGVKPVALHLSEKGAADAVESLRKGLSEPAKKLIQYEPFDLKP